MNNNRGNNRRRGRGNNRQQGNQPTNRIDSRARGNAQQLLDKYKKLAHDSHLNGDRVQEEYNLQFADHYFRVLADQKLRQDEARQRRDERSQDGGDSNRSDGSQDRDRSEDDGQDDRARRGKSAADAPNDDGEERDSAPQEASDNPFVQEKRSPRGGARQRKPRRDARDDDSGNAKPEADSAGVDPSVLPPSIGSSDEDGEEAPAKPRRRTRKPRDDDGSGEALESVS